MTRLTMATIWGPVATSYEVALVCPQPFSHAASATCRKPAFDWNGGGVGLDRLHAGSNDG